MLLQPEKYKILQVKNKPRYFTINSSKTPISNSLKNKYTCKLSNKTLSIKDNSIHPSSPFAIINSGMNKRKVKIQKYSKDVPKLKSYLTVQNTIENESMKNKKLFKIANFKKKFTKNIYTNFYDINNNNYFVNLYDTSTTIPQKYKGRNSVINKNFYTKVVHFRNLNDKATIFEHKKNQTDYFETSIIDNNNNNIYLTTDTKEMLKNYRNKLLKEFMKYLKKFYINYYKKYFIVFINQLKLIKKKQPLKQYVYSKKIQKQPKIFKKTTYLDSVINKKKAEKKKLFINKKIINSNRSLNLTDRKLDKNNIVSKIINNQSNELIDGKIRNIFLDSSFLNEANSINSENIGNDYINHNSLSLDNNHSYRGFRHRIFLNDIISPNRPQKDNNYREIKINFHHIEEMKKEREKELLSFNNKIKLRFNEIVFNEQDNKKEVNNNKEKKLEISKLVNSFSIVTDKKDSKKLIFVKGRKKFFNLLKNKKFLSSIKEEDEKYSLSMQDSIPAENTKIFIKDNINIRIIQNKIKLKALINAFAKEKYKKYFINNLKGISFTYKINKFNLNNSDKNVK